MTETVHLEVDGRAMDVLVAAPTGRGPHPTVLLMFHRGGMDGCTAHYVEQLPRAGYLTIVPNFYHHCPKDVPLHDCKQFLKDTEVIREIGATADYALGRSDVDNDRLFIMGHCMGGRLTYLGAGTKPVFTAAIAYYSGGVMANWGGGAPKPFDVIRDIRCPVYGFYGDLDRNPAPEEVDEIEAELARHGIERRFYRYPDAGHGFQNPIKPNRTPQEDRRAEEAWVETLRLMAAECARVGKPLVQPVN